jgi:hypothetical protein
LIKLRAAQTRKKLAEERKEEEKEVSKVDGGTAAIFMSRVRAAGMGTNHTCQQHKDGTGQGMGRCRLQSLRVHMASRFDPQITRKRHQLEHTDSSCRTSARKVGRWLTELLKSGDQPSIALQINKTDMPVISRRSVLSRIGLKRIHSANKQRERCKGRDGRINEKNDWR